MEKIDALDRKILQIITQNARIPFKDVAEACNVSRAAIHQRVQKMCDNGVIVGSGYQVNPEMLGYTRCVLIGVELTSGSKYKSVVEALKEIPEVVEEYYTLGAYAMLIKMYARNDKDLLRLLNTILNIEGITNTETLTCLEQGIERSLPIE
ncbi:MAG: Lrp/AsnC ligand binding domain-containing protein [Paludibacteraceae bacterium]|nr:Lrp/AsnC ligand binding domain-containing protein [Paludibacteraceae bacterium]